ncbi:MAG: hypothetical protein ACRDCE_06055 [Cetobacterium sp.]|uniref:hypothetical protein n=1 Tax=Cetobacterium sp. TaxID=2071632 RepID=UPI003EE7348A
MKNTITMAEVAEELKNSMDRDYCEKENILLIRKRTGITYKVNGVNQKSYQEIVRLSKI